VESEWDKRSSQTERATFHPYTGPHRPARTRVMADRVAENDLARSRKRRCSDENKRVGRVKRTSHLSRPPGVASMVLDCTAATRAQRETRSERCLCSLPRCLGPLEDRGNLGWRQKNAQPRGAFCGAP
jgi:hypothetical protein